MPPSPSISPFDFDPSHPWPTGATRTVAIGETGLALGAGTVLAPSDTSGVAKGAGRLAVDPERVLAVAAGRPVDAARALAGVAAAAGHWARGDRALANIRLLFAGLPRLATPLDAERLRAAAWLLDEGMTPRRLMEELGFEAASLDEAVADHLTKYNPDQPRVPAGNGVESGRWIGADGAFGLTGRLRVSQLRFDPVRVAANGPFTDGGQATTFTTPGSNPLDPKGLNKPTTAEERQALIDTLNTFVEGRGSRFRQIFEKYYENYPHPETKAVLPDSPGNYKEYTVRTPNKFNRAERRLVIDWSNGNMYYSNNHYKSFYRFRIVPTVGAPRLY